MKPEPDSTPVPPSPVPPPYIARLRAFYPHAHLRVDRLGRQFISHDGYRVSAFFQADTDSDTVWFSAYADLYNRCFHFIHQAEV